MSSYTSTMTQTAIPTSMTPATSAAASVDSSSLVQGFQWLNLTTSWGGSDDGDDDGTDSPLVSRSDHRPCRQLSASTFTNNETNTNDEPYSYPNRTTPQLTSSTRSVGSTGNSNSNGSRGDAWGLTRSDSSPDILGKMSSSSSSPSRPRSRSTRQLRRQRINVESASQSYNRGRKASAEYHLKNAKDALVGSVSAIINFLGSAGVPKPSIDELKSNMEMGRFFATLKRVQDYIRCVQSKDDDDMLAMVHLSVTAWEALCRFKTLEYKRAYKHAYQLRYGGLTHSQLAAPTSSTASNAEIKQAIEMQVQIAEQLTACQKKLYLVNRWKMRVLRKTKRASTFEPQGYQPIRCL